MSISLLPVLSFIVYFTLSSSHHSYFYLYPAEPRAYTISPFWANEENLGTQVPIESTSKEIGQK